MRDIKIRAWYENSQTWVYFTIGQFWSDEGIKVYEEIVLSGTKFYQWTGLKDKNGKEIYEGDIISCDVVGGSEGMEYDHICRVEYDHDFAQYHIIGKSRNIDVLPHLSIPRSDKGWFLPLFDCENKKRIGNIHQNPELL